MKNKDEQPSEAKVRRKSVRNENSSSSVKVGKSDELKQKSELAKTSLKVKGLPENLDQQIISFEENQATKRDSASDLHEFQDTCSNIENIVIEMNELRSQGMSNDDATMLDKRLDATILTTNLKRLNRYAQIRGKRAKESTLEVKNKVDDLNLDLQNLLYEIMHMKKEIQKCMNFSSKDEEIDLVDVETFYKEAPESISKPDITRTDPHPQMLARLDWELKRRKELVELKDGLKSDKKKQENDLVKKSEYLRSLKPRLDEIMKATKPLQEYMNIPAETDRLTFDTAQYLPRPLYILYIQAKAYKDVCDKHMDVKIDGDIELARTEFHSDDAESDIESSSEEETKDTNDNDDSESSGKRDKKQKGKNRIEEHKKRLLRRHPLHIAMTLSKEGGYAAKLKFHYLPQLHIGTVELDLSINDSEITDTKCDLLAANGILNDLISNDNGKNSPNSANNYQLERLGMPPFSSHIFQIGLPYFWVQWICGLNYLPNEEIKSYTPDSSFSASNFQTVVRGIKKRIEARIDLQKQLEKLENLTIPSIMNNGSNTSLSCKLVCLLTSWTKIPIENLQLLPRYHELEECNLLREDCMVYEATLTREEALKVSVVLHSNYPTQPPLMLLEDPTKSINAVPDLRCLECEVNVFTDEMLKEDHENMLLSSMLRKLQVCFDMYVETGSRYSTKEKLYTRKCRGRDRNRPYKYHKDSYFIHR